MGGHLGGILSPHAPNIHYFADDMEQVHNNIHKAMSYQPKRVFVGYGGMLLGDNIRRCFPIPVDRVTSFDVTPKL